MPAKSKVLLTGVYKLKNKINGKVYIGSSSHSLKERWWAHKKALRLGRHGNRYLQRAWDKYGEESFEWTVLERCKPEDCIAREQYWLDHFKSADYEHGYNLCSVAGSTLGVKLSSETCARISASKKGVGLGKKHSPEFRRAASIRMMRNKVNLGRKRGPQPLEERMRRVIDLVGQRFGRLVVLRFVDVKPHARWLCKCDCGKKVIVFGNSLRQNRTKSCGCLLSDILRKRNSSNKSGRA